MHQIGSVAQLTDLNTIDGVATSINNPTDGLSLRLKGELSMPPKILLNVPSENNLIPVEGINSPIQVSTTEGPKINMVD